MLVRALIAILWLGVGIAKVAVLVWLIEQHWKLAVLALLTAWSLAGLALWLRALRRA